MEPIRINARLTLREHRSGIRYGTDALLLASFVRGRRNAKCADLGTGCGVIPLLLLASGRCGEARGGDGHRIQCRVCGATAHGAYGARPARSVRGRVARRSASASMRRGVRGGVVRAHLGV